MTENNFRSNGSVPDDTRREKQRRESVDAMTVKAVTIASRRQDVFDYYSQISNLSLFMANIEHVEDLVGGRSHWVVNAPTDHTV